MSAPAFQKLDINCPDCCGHGGDEFEKCKYCDGSGRLPSELIDKYCFDTATCYEDYLIRRTKLLWGGAAK